MKLTIATVALKDFEDSLQMSIRPSGGGFPASASIYVSQDTGSFVGGSRDALLTVCEKHDPL